MHRSVLPFLLCLSSAHLAAASIVTFFDGTLADADWQVTSFSFGSNGGALPGGSVAASQQTGGNPGTMREVTNNIPAAPSGSEFASTFGIHLRAGFTYDPSVQGAIGTIDYFEDARNITAGQLSGFAVRQNGKFYFTQAGVHGSTAWGRIQQLGIVPGVFYEITADGPIPSSKPDFSGTGALLELGFVRASSNGNGGGAYPVVSAIDNWKVRINPPCTLDVQCDDNDACATETCTAGTCAAVDKDCDDADPCTIDGCDAGTCTHVPVDCDDADACTADSCVGGTCQHTVATDFATVIAKVDEMRALLAGSACGEEPLAKKLRKKIGRKLQQIDAALGRADDATKAALVRRLLDKADALLGKARSLLVTAVSKGTLSPACAAALDQFLAKIAVCASGIPRP